MSTIECSCRLWPTPGIYVVTSSPLVNRTRATLRNAEFGFFGVCVYTRVHTPRFCGEPCSAGLAVLYRGRLRPSRTYWLEGGHVAAPCRAQGGLSASSAQRNSASPAITHDPGLAGPKADHTSRCARMPREILDSLSDLRRRRWHPAKTAGALRFVSRALHILPQTTRHLS